MEMNETKVRFSNTKHLMELLAGKVFHITSSKHMVQIERAGEIIPNETGMNESIFGNSMNGFFRNRGCVSFFDYRDYGSKDWEEHAYKCPPSQALSSVNSMYCLILAESQHHLLESWESWKIEQKWSQRVVPYVETGYRGKVSLSHISETLLIFK